MPATCFPTASALASSWDVELLGEVGAALGAEAAAHGVDVLLGPGLNITRDPRCGRAFEYFSEDPHLAGTLAAAMVRGIQSRGVSACPKHFAVNSQETRRMASDSIVDERTLREIYLTAFEIVVRDARPDVVMSSYNRVNGTYAHENEHLLTQILREEWGFDGLVVSDWGGGNDPVAAAQAGGTLEMPSPGMDSVRRVLAALDDGTLDEADLDARAAEVIALAARERPRDAGRVPDPAALLEEHHALARRAAARSAVLLKNDPAAGTDHAAAAGADAGDGPAAPLLPLAPGTRIAVIGDMARTPRYQGAGSSEVNASRVTDPATALAASALEVVAETQGYRRDGTADPALRDQAVAAAREADVAVLFLGLDEMRESEGLDRTDLALAAVQIELLAAVRAVNPRTVVVLAAGAPVELGWAQDAAALVHMHLAGQAGGQAVADLLTGAAEPGGRLAQAHARSLADHPTADSFPALGEEAVYAEGLRVGYRHLDTAGIDVGFPFGFGLGYGRVALADLRVDRVPSADRPSADRPGEAAVDGASTDGAPTDGAPVTLAVVRLTATNVSDREIGEIIQLYVSRPSSAIDRPVHELRGFARVELGPGESREVAIELTERAFRHYDRDREAWAIEGGDAVITVGRHSRDRVLEATLHLEDRVLEAAPADPAAPRTAAETALRAIHETRPLAGDAAVAERRELGPNDTLRDLEHARSPLGRGAHRVLTALLRRAERSGQPDLNLLLLHNMPFRAIAKMSGGLLGTDEVRGIVDLVNGHHLAGLRRIARAALTTRTASRSLAREIEGR
ncbi:glycoside hydrolase family 3 C-terminal domain-containing protein [Brachybacterium nesterenkovii]|uniref:glycoside hydrolase family 3 C-terminal domain-containing protein n=1 Tax=Brachybacterium nesterenkovii TaxID=47847 RepID=UPI00321A76E8